jgi:peroxiredoxin
VSTYDPRDLLNLRLPAMALSATNGSHVDISALKGRAVVYIYPQTGRPGLDQEFSKLRILGITQIFGLSTEDTAYQREAAHRFRLPFPLLSDEHLALTRALALPTCYVEGVMLLERMALLVDEGVITKVFYPVSPDESPHNVVAWILASPIRPTHDEMWRNGFAFLHEFITNGFNELCQEIRGVTITERG